MQGRRFEEFDLDGALQRRPKLIIVDELAHSNAPESRHPKRWQDVEELLDASIDVWTALNVQHLESLADVVSRVTGVTVRETVPDIVLRDADDLVLVDITAEELIARLKEGKVYLPETAKLASQKFFTRRNLTALRELALRRTAARVDDLMVEQLRQSAIQGPWAAASAFSFASAPDKRSLDVVRAASRLATALNADWCAAHVRRPRRRGRSRGARRGARLWRAVSAQRSSDWTGRIARRKSSPTRGARISRRSWSAARRGRAGGASRPSLAEQLARDARVVDVHVITGGEVDTNPSRRWLARLLRRPRSARLAGACRSGGLGRRRGGGRRGADGWIPLPNLSMIFLAAVLVCAVQFGVRPAIAAAVLSFFADDFFFIPPLYQFTIAEPQEFFSLIVFCRSPRRSPAGLRDGRRIRSGSRRERARARNRCLICRAGLSGAVSLDDILETAAVYVQKTLKAEAVVMLLPENGELTRRLAPGRRSTR